MSETTTTTNDGKTITVTELFFGAWNYIITAGRSFTTGTIKANSASDAIEKASKL
jgi:hypothetical protein